jgi:hypothetical protein
MKKKLIFSSVLLITSLLIISLFVWTANAVGNTDNGVKNKDNVIGNKDDLIENADNTNEPIIEDTDISVDDTDTSIDDTDTSVDESDTSVDVDDNSVNESDLIDGADNTTDGTDNITNYTDSVDYTNNSVDDDVDDNDSSVDISLNDTNTSVDDDIDDTNISVDDNIDDTNISVDDNVDDTNISEDDNVDDANISVDDNDSSVNDNYSVDDTNNSVNDNGNVDDTNISVNDNDNSVDGNDNSVDTQSPELTVNEPSFDSVCTNNVLFNFSASDELDNNITYTLYIDGAEKSTGIIAKDECKEVEVNLEDGFYTWEIKIKDGLGNIDSSEPTDLYVDTKEPDVTLISPEEGIINTGGPLNFSFVADDDFTAQYKDLNLTYEVDVDDEPLEGLGSGTMRPGECIQTQDITNFSEGAHYWSVYIEDPAGNNVTSDSRNFYVDKKGLRVSLVSPDNESISKSPIFKFNVSGGTGQPFNYTLLINGEEVKRSTCDGSENRTLEVGEDFENDYSIKAPVPDGEDLTWTVRLTDVAGNSYEPEPYHFSLDTASPARVANLSVIDAPSETQWSYTHDSPGLYVSWDVNAGGDLASTPYDVFISDFEPRSIEDMEKVKSTSYPGSYIGKYGGKPLEYGKDYWVAVIARDKFGNYNKCFVAISGPVRTYEDMNITLDSGWNMESVPKRLLESNSSPESVFGKNSTILYWNGASWEVPKTIEPCKGYWVYSPEASENNVKFKPIPSDNASDYLPASLDLAPGWQMIGSTSMQPVAWSTTLASLKNSYTDYEFSNLVTYSHNEGWSGVIPELGLTPLADGSESVAPNSDLINDSGPRPVGMLQSEGMMVPGQGYWVYMSKAGAYNPSESNGTADDVPVDDSFGDNVTIDEGDADNGTTDEVAVDEGTAFNGTTDNGITDNITVDKGTAFNGTTENGTTDEADADEGTVDDVPIDGGTADDVAVDEGTADNVAVDEGSTDNASTDNGASDNLAVDDGNSADDENSDFGNADEIPVGD